MDDKFILVRRKYRQGGSNAAKIHVQPQTYETLQAWAAKTGLPLSELAARAVAFAEAHAVFVDE